MYTIIQQRYYNINSSDKSKDSVNFRMLAVRLTGQFADYFGNIEQWATREKKSVSLSFQ